jgi:hypothetical protein
MSIVNIKQHGMMLSDQGQPTGAELEMEDLWERCARLRT